MGVLNVTPDSFSGDGIFFSPERVKEKINYLLNSGCHIIDVGGESTRPGFSPVSASEELERIVSVLDIVRSSEVQWVSIDSTKPMVVERALLSGVQIVNDVNGFCDPELIKLAKQFDAYCVLTHNARMPEYALSDNSLLGIDLVKKMIDQLKRGVSKLLAAGIKRDKIILDPGLGFGKTIQQNWDIVKYCDYFSSLNYPVLYGASRKSFIGSLCDASVDRRLAGSLGVVAYCFQKGIRLFRVHDVYESNQVLQVLSSLA